MSQKVPAWKRLGLKLKGDAAPSPSSGTAAATSNNNNNNTNHSSFSPQASNANGLKRNFQSSSYNVSSNSIPNKRPRGDQWEQPSSRQKNVSFAEGTNTEPAATPVAVKDKKPKKPKKAKKPKDVNSTTVKPDFSLEPAIAYLRQWQTDRDGWKFNKNHQTLLIKYLFDADKVPSPEIPVFYQYIRDLKGAVRNRLRETAAEIKKKDMEQVGTAGFPAPAAGKKDKREAKQKEYEQVISQFLLEQQQRVQENATASSSAEASGSNSSSSKKRTFDEVEFVLRTADPLVKQRLLKRIRAEMVLEELSDSESTASATTTTTTTSAASSGRMDEDTDVVVEKMVAGRTSPAKAKQADAPQQPAKRRRLRNLRTAVESDDSSSESDDAEDAEESSSSSSDDDSEDEDMELIPAAVAAALESSSSSSSSSEAESAGTDDEDESSDDESDDDED
ncbi:hypothetical protein B0T17DRAFT_587290 [Bombardia bombarda]|uniref:WKF domain-containing protein n=1 Tax=Bombardia bombarda TaxID=252184 RepID=A0AA39XLQ9_9PEZI|nr:hypothetical protein B0T17DRAFT_587290 [Bombardia bombarda]